MARHLNGVKYPKSQEDLQVIVGRVEEKFARHIIVPTSTFVILKVAESVDPKVTVVAHSEECRCDACVHAYLEAMEQRSAQILGEAQVVVKQTQEVELEINFIG